MKEWPLVIIGLIICTPFYIWIVKSVVVDLPREIYKGHPIKKRGDKVIAILKAIGITIIMIAVFALIGYWLYNSSSDAGTYYQEYTERREPGW